ncbi:hypothetical protein LOZ53_000661 [Ophidiomyces ophidiicola]|nr:hypothetical protein LOZ55_002032 [Ophidiomyces ophidiicola]KAI1992547.1 hypothetical protein LOZ54_001623 [Ophidiomyces ophidiicola]KAI1992910.1 hypothetical protein LOZ51_004224 [Ophidiomyces ophidiicola]KAI1997301.1 hypothetical protein LOZ53_000661 [Ophidiomyces ophidiicola]
MAPCNISVHGPKDSQEVLVIPPKDKVIDLPWVSTGVSGLVVEASDSAVIKFPVTGENRAQAQIECAIYKRLGLHPQITKLLSIQHDDMLVLERLQCPLRQRLLDLRNAGRSSPTQSEILRWASQIGLGLEYIHSRGVFQIDIGAHNVLLDWDDNVKLNDFAGSSLDGSKPLILCGTRFEHPSFPSSQNPSIRTEIFAFGSLLYEIETTHHPYPEKSDREVELLYKVGIFPDARHMILGQVIHRCWMMEYRNVGEALDDMRRIQGCIIQEGALSTLIR